MRLGMLRVLINISISVSLMGTVASIMGPTLLQRTVRLILQKLVWLPIIFPISIFKAFFDQVSQIPYSFISLLSQVYLTF